MLLDSLEAMQTDLEAPSTDFYADDLDFRKSPITEVPIAGEQGSPYQPEETQDYCNLDERRDLTIYQRDDVYMDRTSVSPEHHLCDSSVQDRGTENLESFGYYTVCPQRRSNLQDQLTTRAFAVCLQDVEDTCRCLGIARDPLLWTHDQVQQWIVWQCRQFNVPEPNMDIFLVSGAELCIMKEEEFRIYAPSAGSTLFARLEVWRSVVEQTTSQIYTDVLPTLSSVPVPVSPSRTSSSGSISPAPSSCSEPEIKQETPETHTKTCDDNDRLPEEPVHHHRQTIQLWQFLKLLLLDGHYTDCIRWVDRSRGIFKIENSSRVARLWGKRKNRPAMNYDKLSRSIRQYYKKNIIKKTEHSKRLVYQFCQM
ncbi:SAM pointed domain-containing Ets transcription factor-like isoform X2 [Mercenaria mercenaria]|nr:SAM pointed domain-containing Ets transcription factor-like isoform X2 [Mercenaria mercenaria]